MRASTRDQLVDLAFLIGVLFKGINGLVELAVGSLLVFINSAQLVAWGHRITKTELGEDRHDLTARLILHLLDKLNSTTLTFVSVYLIVHGLVKVVLVAALMRGSTKVYPWAVGALGLFLAFQFYELVVHPTLAIGVLALFDAIIVALTLREWRHGRPLKETMRGTMRWLRHPRTTAEAG